MKPATNLKNNICLLCIMEQPENDYMTICETDYSILEQIQQCLQLKLNFKTESTAQICNTCLNSLNSSHEFYEKIHNIQCANTQLAQEDFKLLKCELTFEDITIRQTKLNNNNNESNKNNNNIEVSTTNIKDETSNEEEEDSTELNLEATLSEDDEVASDDVGEEKTKSTSLGTISSWKSYPWYCFLCIYSTLNISTLIAHLKAKHDLDTTKKMQYQCIDCKKIFNAYTAFLNHVREKHHPNLNLCCDICCEFFKDHKELSTHHLTHVNQKDLVQPFVRYCNHCPKVYPSRQTINKHVLSHENSLDCQFCQKSFKCLKYLKRHMEMHVELKYKCSYCSKTFHRQFNKINHERTHTGERPYKCDECEQTFSFQSSLKSHKRTHTGEMPYKCDECSDQFRYSDSLKEHKRKHSNETPLKCQHCKETFRYRKSMHRHMQTQHKESTEKVSKTARNTKKISVQGSKYTKQAKSPNKKSAGTTHKCVKCKKSFSTAKTLKAHKCTS